MNELSSFAESQIRPEPATAFAFLKNSVSLKQEILLCAVLLKYQNLPENAISCLVSFEDWESTKTINFILWYKIFNRFPNWSHYDPIFMLVI